MSTPTMDQRLDKLSDLLTAAVREQSNDDDPAHEDFYAWGWMVSELTARVEDVGRVLSRQVARYGERRILRDDDGADPADRLAEATACLSTMMAAAREANAAARAYHSAVGHIAVEVDAP